jgi:hypothetical protein
MWHFADLIPDAQAIFWLVAGSVAIVGFIAASITSIMKNRAREQTRREIAAYLAEGSIDKETALAMLKQGDEDEDEET